MWKKRLIKDINRKSYWKYMYGFLLSDSQKIMLVLTTA